MAKKHRWTFCQRNLKPHIFILAACLVSIFLLTTTISNNEHKNRATLNQGDVSSICKNDRLEIGVTINALDRRFLGLGGTRHWFHLLERLTQQIDTFHELHMKINQLKIDKLKITNGASDGVSLYIIFDKKSDVQELGPFGRLLFSSLTSGRGSASSVQFDKIIFGYSTDIKRGAVRKENEKENENILGAIEEHNFKPQFTVDFYTQRTYTVTHRINQ